MTLDSVLHLLQVYGYVLLLPIAIIEGPVATVLAGFLVTLGIFNLFIVYGVVVFGDALGDALYYLLGRLGGKKSALTYGAWAGVTPEKLEKAEALFTNHRRRALALTKFVHGIGFVGLIAAGILRIPYRKLVFTGLLLSALQAAVFLCVGLVFGSAYESFGRYLDYYAIGASAVALVAGILYVLHKRTS